MKQEVFEQHNQAFWQSFSTQLEELEQGRKDSFRQFASHYRRLCQHLAIARHRGYSQHLIIYLNDLMLRGHQMLHKRPSHFWLSLTHFLAVQFPHSIRTQWRYVMVATLLMYLPAVLLIGAIQVEPDLVYLVVDAHQLSEYESMYDPSSESLGKKRESSTDLQMFGYYIQNNIGIAFRTFATGIVFALGSIFFLVFNGVFFGVIGGHLTEIGYTETFWTFVIAHSAFEVTAITFAGAAGMKLGFTLLSPGARTRAEALKQAARECIPILYGMTIMLLIAAFIEAFWSSDHTLPATVKYSVGAAMWLMVIAYFTLAGRSAHEPR
ncbi:stage II sporulation protein M [Gynuella sunshinyii]|uniref:Putative membrane protein n=1 Tax=Gynuella sunshinyii YC6258 TaxID=1445510 RepID=A0A0C5VCN2_9GAMM|nr:stage II sporulation protein M [Gynuella sunshinyii]AJQ97095.1 putative membrane protein [Gynuella sunshinyii YC6258]